MSGYRVFGIWFCKPCKQKQQFIAFDPSVTDPDFAECILCGYQFGKAIDETAETPTERVKSVLSKAVVEAGAREFIEQERQRRARNGVPMSVPNEIRRELTRRQEEW